MGTIGNLKVAAVFEHYPEHIQKKLLFLRQMILDTALEIDGIDPLEETLKWGEPSYVTKSGSTIRIDWKKSSPHQYAMYFNCNTMLVDTFKELFRDIFSYEGNRAIVFGDNDEIPVDELKQCISLSLTYHSRRPMIKVQKKRIG
ncbi:protein of unknown function (DU1801) [Paenibacillus algorifonticola]|uniref:YdhG-like domain-containing protein n=1 Tax=Paenibacillus algorifonticola TaxID=684063 RepID=A0A1I2HCM4_9BACL|nr:DUF1801 domain-containing protein [Paenibacillus algorifonticola]SFF26311.1 protein of unknown function (DU1801) [Paenibacillus algorifonticola]